MLNRLVSGPPSALVRRTLAVVLAAGLLAGAAACSSDSSSDSATPGTASGGGSGATATVPDDCPFSGTTVRTQGGQSGLAGVTFQKATNRRDGCVDGIQFDLSPGVPGYSVAYTNGPVTDAAGATVPVTGAATLVVTISGTTYDAAKSAPVSLSTDGLDYVQSMQIATGSGGSVLIVLGLDSKLEFQVSDSQTPSYISLGLG